MEKERMNLRYEPVNEIPEMMVDSLVCETVPPEYPQIRSKIEGNIKKDQFKLVVYDGKNKIENEIGFVAGMYFDNRLHIDGLYVTETYRRRGIARVLLYRSILHAKRKGLDGLNAWGMNPKFAIVFKNIKERCKANQWLDISLFFEEDQCACVNFVKNQ